MCTGPVVWGSGAYPVYWRTAAVWAGLGCILWCGPSQTERVGAIEPGLGVFPFCLIMMLYTHALNFFINNSSRLPWPTAQTLLSYAYQFAAAAGMPGWVAPDTETRCIASCCLCCATATA